MGIEGGVKLCDAATMTVLAEGSYFYGIGKKAWFKAAIYAQLVPNKRYMIMLFLDKDSGTDRYYYTVFGRHDILPFDPRS